MIQWLGLFAFTVRARVQFLVRELRSLKIRDMAKKRKRKKKKIMVQTNTGPLASPDVGQPGAHNQEPSSACSSQSAALHA